MPKKNLYGNWRAIIQCADFMEHPAGGDIPSWVVKFMSFYLRLIVLICD